MAHLHEVRDFDTHYKIDPITMAITNANEAKNKLMLGDHDSEIYTFEIPKVVEGHDMSLCNMVEVHFINIAADKANKSVGVYPVKDLAHAEDDEDTLLFTWKVSGESTRYAGSLNYRIKFACLDENGKYTYKKWTDIYRGITISDGFDNGASVEKEYSDILSDWEARLDALEQGGASDEQIAQAVNNYLQENPVQSGATDEQAAQIKKNKEDIEKLATDTVDNDQLLNAVNDALEQAKASGDFKGDPGDDYILTDADKTDIAEQAAKMVEVEIPEGEGAAGENGGYYTPKVEQTDANTMKVSYTASKSGMPAVAEQTITLPAGKTPVKGTDYYTEADKTEMVNAVVAALPKYDGEVVDV